MLIRTTDSHKEEKTKKRQKKPHKYCFLEDLSIANFYCLKNFRVFKMFLFHVIDVALIFLLLTLPPGVFCKKRRC